MNQEQYKANLLSNFETAIKQGEALLKTSKRLHKVCDTVDKKDPSVADADAFYQDTLMYFDFNDAVTELSAMPKKLEDFKKSLISIMSTNGNLLLIDQYRKDIDECIVDIFSAGTLYDISTIEAPTLSTVREAVEALKALKETI